MNCCRTKATTKKRDTFKAKSNNCYKMKPKTKNYCKTKATRKNYCKGKFTSQYKTITADKNYWNDKTTINTERTLPQAVYITCRYL